MQRRWYGFIGLWSCLDFGRTFFNTRRFLLPGGLQCISWSAAFRNNDRDENSQRNYDCNCCKQNYSDLSYVCRRVVINHLSWHYWRLSFFQDNWTCWLMCWHNAWRRRGFCQSERWFGGPDLFVARCGPNFALVFVTTAFAFNQVFLISTTLWTRVTWKRQRFIVISFFAPATLAVWLKGAVLQYCFPCRAYRAGLAMSLVVFVRVCFAKMTWNTVNIGPIFNFGSTWYRRLWSSRTGRAVQALISCLSSGVCPNYLFRFTREICSNGTNLLMKEWHIVKKACICIRLPIPPACFSLMSW